MPPRSEDVHNRRMSILGAIGRILGHTLAGALALPVLAFGLSMIVYLSDSRCGTPGDSGGCEMGLAMVVLGATPVGAVIGCVVGIWRVIRARRKPTPNSIP